MAARFEYRQAQEIAAAFHRHRVRYFFIGKSGAILLGYPDTTQDAYSSRRRVRRTAVPWSLRWPSWDSP
ncbi:MAG TPA: hypothetical protein VLK65_07885 [Vicinamibacteria bacterium]|nr:hypothetical protein [Vicinamibacteria bacterium]